MMLRLITLIVIVIHLLVSTSATEETCHLDCDSPDRSPTRPWNETDPLRNPLRLTRPYPFHIAANDDLKEYDLPAFCKLGCNYFFVSDESSKTTTLDTCLEKCDDEYSWTTDTPPYNDYIEMARLECRDGCLIALKRCQSGYYCEQVSFDDDDNEDNTYQGGNMHPCNPGTYRDVDYTAVEECIPCSPNYYREDIKGRSIESCSPCPAGTFAVNPGSTSIKACLRCPAGTYSEEGDYCKCITPQACVADQLPPPADAEKKGTQPYIGRW